MADLQSQEAYRALQVLDHVPAGCKAFLVRDEAFEPHLNEGEFAVVEIDDRSHHYGELYVITINSIRGPEPRIVQITRFGDDDTGVWYAFGFGRPIQLGSGRCGRYIDGPCGYEYWPERCAGRIVGVIEVG